MAVAVALGLAVGAALGLLGGGGSILTVPALVYGLNQPVQEAVPTSLLVVGSASAAGAVSHMRAGPIPWRTGALFGAAGAAGAFAGAFVNHRIDDAVVLGGFAVVMVAAALAMLGRTSAAPEDRDEVPDQTWRRRWPRITGAGAGVGFLTGLFGVGGGFVIVPALVLLLDFPMHVAVGTSLVIVVVNSAAGLAAHLSLGAIDYPTAAAFTAGGLAGAVGGERLGERISAQRLSRWFAYLVLAVAAFVMFQVLVVGELPA